MDELKSRPDAMMSSLAGKFCLAVSLLAVVLSGCNRGGAAPAAAGMPPAPVVTVRAATANVPLYLDEIGKTSATAVVMIQPQVSGKIIETDFKDGSDLTQGEKLFAIDPRPFQAVLDAALASVDLASAQLNLAQDDFKRVAGLLASKAVAQQDYDDKKNGVAVSQATLRAAEAAVEAAQLNLNYCTIVSPIAGRASAAMVDPGNVVTSNTTNLLSIQTLSPIYVDFTIPESDLPQVRKNMANGALAVQILPGDETKNPVTGKLEFLDNSVQDGTGTIKLRATVDNKDHALWPGQFAHVRLILATLQDTVLVPAEAIQVGQQGAFVFVVHHQDVKQADGSTLSTTIAEQRSVTPGQRQGDQVAITDGLKADEEVVRTGQIMVQPGGPVMVVNAPATPGGPAASAMAGSGK